MQDILIVGAGGAGMNALSDLRLASAGRCVGINTDLRRLTSFSKAEKLQIGMKTCNGGPAVIPARGECAARESLQDLDSMLQPNLMGLFVIAGLGGGTGTGVLTVLAELAKTKAIPFSAAVTLPPAFSGFQRDAAISALAILRAQDIEVFVVDLQEGLDTPGEDLAHLLERANTKLVDYVLSRAQVVA